MKLKKYKSDLQKRLRDPAYAALYLAEALELNDKQAFLVALRDVVEVEGGVGPLANHVNIQRPSLYKILSEEGNPRLDTLQEILQPLGLCLSIKQIDEEKEAA